MRRVTALPTKSPWHASRARASGGRAHMLAAMADAETGARGLLGCILVRSNRWGVVRAVIVETEAYPSGDPASHSFAGPTRRNSAMFGPAGRAYVYRIHRSNCLNVVTGPEGRGEAVLIRAVEPIDGIALATRLRAEASVGRRPPSGYSLTNGPGKLCQALGVGLDFDGHDLLAKARLYLEPRHKAPSTGVSTRIGISRSREHKLRFFIKGNPWVSR